jgi:glucuronate isomerase
VPAATIRDNQPFPDPAALLVTGDHYVTRLLHSQGVDLASLGLDGSEPDPREIWRTFAAHWYTFAGTASGYWLADTLSTLFDIDELGPENADAAYDVIAAKVASDDFRPRALMDSFRIDVLATTDDPLDNLGAHAALAADTTFAPRVPPTFRPDAYLDVCHPDFPGRAQSLLEFAPNGGTSLADYLGALRARRAHFIAHGATSADFGVTSPFTVDLGQATAETLFQQAMRHELKASDVKLLQGHLLFESARMSVDDGLVMTIHAGVLRQHHRPTFDAYGPDTGHDIPVSTEFTHNLRPMLEAFGTAPGFHLVVFTVDESTFSRELAPLAGFYPSVYVGAPWWFLDAPHAITRFRDAVTETAGFYKTSGFIDDTRAFLSIPARHDASRRLDARYLAELVLAGQVSRPAAQRIALDLVDSIPRGVFKL